MNKTPIEPADIRKGDLIRWESDGATVSGTKAAEYEAQQDGSIYWGKGTHYLLDRPTPPVALPTEPGWYLSSSSYSIKVGGVLQLRANGDWWWVGNMFGTCPERLGEGELLAHAPLTRLEPVANTAERVLDEVRKFLKARESGAHPSVTTFHRTSFVRDLDTIATGFGVSE